MTSSRRLEPPKNDGDGFAETVATFDEIFSNIPQSPLECHGLGGTLNSSHTRGVNLY